MRKYKFELEVVYATDLYTTEEIVVSNIMNSLKLSDKDGWVVVAPSKNPHYGFYQLCPKCEGEGQIPNIGTSSSVWRVCPVCNGAKLLVRPEIKNDVRVPTENEIDFINFK